MLPHIDVQLLRERLSQPKCPLMPSSVRLGNEHAPAETMDGGSVPPHCSLSPWLSNSDHRLCPCLSTGPHKRGLLKIVMGYISYHNNKSYWEPILTYFQKIFLVVLASTKTPKQFVISRVRKKISSLTPAAHPTQPFGRVLFPVVVDHQFSWLQDSPSSEYAAFPLRALLSWALAAGRGLWQSSGGHRGVRRTEAIQTQLHQSYTLSPEHTSLTHSLSLFSVFQSDMGSGVGPSVNSLITREELR